MGTQISQANVQGGVLVGRSWAESPGSGTATTNTITKAQIEAGNRFLYVVSDVAGFVDIGDTPDGSNGDYAVVPGYPLILALNSAHYDKKVAFAADA